MEARFGIIELPRSIQSAVDYARLAEEMDFDLAGIGDSQSLFREAFVTLGAIGQAAERVMIGASVTNLITRHGIDTLSQWPDWAGAGSVGVGGCCQRKVAAPQNLGRL